MANGNGGVEAGRSVFGNGGRWATEQLIKAAAEGKALNASALRTLDTLRHEEWKFFDDALIAEALIQLKGVADLIAAGLVRPVPNSLGKTVFGYEKSTFMDPAILSLDGVTRDANDRQEFELLQMPLPITHKDFFLNLRTLAASREKGEPLDTMQVRTAGRVCAELQEKLLFQGSTQVFGGMKIYGYTTHVDRNTGGFITNGNWGAAAKTGADILADVLKMIAGIQADRYYGPYWLYVPRDASAKLEDDFKAFGTQTIRQRIEAIEGIAKVQVVDQLPSANVVMVNASVDVACYVQGEPLQTVQWDLDGGFNINFKAFQIGVPLIRSDAQGRSGIYHMS